MINIYLFFYHTVVKYLIFISCYLLTFFFNCHEKFYNYFQDDNEGPVTKSIRLTAALILRNLVIYSAHGRRYVFLKFYLYPKKFRNSDQNEFFYRHLRAYEPHLAGVALSNVESSRTIAQVLYDMNDQSSSGHR